MTPLLPTLLIQGRRISFRRFLSLPAWTILFVLGFCAQVQAGPPGAHTSFGITATITKNHALSDGIQQNIVTVNISPVPSPSQDVTFIISGSSYNPVISTDPVTGNAVLSFSSPVPGPVTVTIEINGVTVATVIPVFDASAGPPNPALSQLYVDVSTTVADGVSTDQLHAHIVDANGNPVKNTTVTFTVTGGIAAGTAKLTSTGGTAPGTITGITDASGNVIVTVTNTTIGNVIVAASVGGGTAIKNSPGQIYFLAGPPDPTNLGSILVVDVSTTIADGVSTDQLHAHVVDKFGNPVSGQAVVFTVTGGSAGGTAILTSTGGTATTTVTGTTDVNGNVTITLTNKTIGDVLVAATVSGIAIKNSPGQVFFTAGPPDPTNPGSVLVVDVSTTTADGVSTDQLHAHIVDKSGNPVSGATVTFTVTGGSAGGTAILTSTGGTAVTTVTGTTDANGNVIITLTNKVAGDVLVAATVGGTAIKNSPGQVFFTAGPPDPTNPGSVLVVDVSPTTADGVSTDQLHAHIVDKSGNPVSGATVTFTVTGGSAGGTAILTSTGGTAITTVTGTTDANGNVIITLTNKVAGDVLVAATVGGTAIKNSPGQVFFTAGTPDPGNAGSVLIVDKGSAIADGIDIDKLHAHIVDKNGNPVSGVTVVFTVAGGTAGGTAILTSTSGTATATVSGITDASGNVIITLTNLKAGTVQIKATVGGAGIGNSPGTVIFTAGAPSPTGGKTQLIIITNNAVADGNATDSLNAFITDINGNPVSGATVTFTVEVGGTAAGTAQFKENVTVTTDANGIAGIGLANTQAGTVNVGAYVSLTAITGSPQTVTFVNTPDVNNPETKLIVVVYQALANGLGTTIVKAHLVDQNGNVISGQTVDFTVDSGKASIVTPGPWVTDGNGEVSISLVSKTPGYALIKAKVGGKYIINGSPARVKFVMTNIYVPPVFTPNGDGTNDLLKPILVGIATFHYFNVYNRWGNLVFTTSDAGQGWDGRFKGVPQPVETYLWIAEGIDTEGNRIVQKGMVSLVR